MANVSRETAERLQHYAALLRKWNPSINLVSRNTLDLLEDRHIADFLQLTALCEPSGLWVDLGSGGGLPGIVLSAAWQDIDLRVILVELDQRKAAFLRQTIRELDLARTEVVNQRIESAPPLNADHVSARALAPLPKLVSYAHRHLKPSGRAWLMKGRNWQEELDISRENWTFTDKAHPSRTDPDLAILEITDISHG